MRASPLEKYKISICPHCQCPIYYDEDNDRYIFEGREHCDCEREGEDDSDSRFPER